MSTFTLCVTEILPPFSRLDDIITRAKHILHPSKNIHLNEQSDVESQWDRPLVEEREEFFVLSREEEKAV